MAIRGYPYMCFHIIGFRTKIILRVCFLGSFATFSSQWGSSKLLAWLKDGEQGHVSVWGSIGNGYVNSVKQLHAKVDGKTVVVSESLVRSVLLFDDEDGITCLKNDKIFENLALMGYEPLSTKLTFQKDKVVHQEEGDRVERAITIVASLEATQDSDNIIKTQTTAMPNVDIPQGIDTGTSPKRQETIGDEEGPSVHIEDSPKQERIIEEMDKDKNINLYSEKGDVHETSKHSRDDDDETLAETLLNIKRSSAKDKGKGIIVGKRGSKTRAGDIQFGKSFRVTKKLDQRKENVPKGDQAKEID
nr:hypothetical protein [Tanacetum cinerariifolium]